jgi:ABC-2 type transport system permease protein
MKASAVATIGFFEVKRYISDRVALFTTVLMPVILVLVIGLSIGGARGNFAVGVIDNDSSRASQDFVALLGEANLDTTAYDDPAALSRDIRLGFLSAGVVIDPGFGAALASADQQAHVTMNLDQASANGSAVATSVTAAAGALTAAPAAIRVTRATLIGQGGPVADVAGQVASAVIADTAPVTTREVLVGTVREEDRNGFATAVPTQLTLFVFLNGMLAGMTLVESRRLGISRRMLSTPTGVGPYILGIGAGRWVLGLIQAALLLAIGALMFQVDFGDWPTVAVLVLLWTALSAAVGMVLGAVGRTPDQVVALSIPLGIGLAMLGGSMWPLSVVPPFMRVLGHLTPHGWANDAWVAIINDGARVPDVATEMGVLLATTIALAGLAVVLLRRSLSR